MMCRGWLVSSHSNRCEWMAELRGKSSWWSFCLSCRQSSRYDLSLESVRSVLQKFQRSGEHLEKRKIYLWLSGAAALCYEFQCHMAWQMRTLMYVLKAWGSDLLCTWEFPAHEWVGWIQQSLMLWGRRREPFLSVVCAEHGTFLWNSHSLCECIGLVTPLLG